MRRWLFWKLWHVGNRLDDAVCWLRGQIGRIEPPFTPLPEPTYHNETRTCACGITIAVPVLSTTSEQERDVLMARYIAAHVATGH